MNTGSLYAGMHIAMGQDEVMYEAERKAAEAAARATGAVIDGALDYEAEYKRVVALNEKLNDENRYLSEDWKTMKNELEKRNAQIEMVYLIFGGFNRG